MLQRPLELGIDMVAHSTTKYIGGHSDVIGGALITGEPNYLFERARLSQKYGGSVPSPFDCWLTLRGLDTLPYRVRAQAENAMRVARFLAAHPAVEKVHYPGLKSIRGTRSRRGRCRHSGACSRSRCAAGGIRRWAWWRAASCSFAPRVWGSAQSDRASRVGGGAGSKTPQNLIRLSIGLEHVDDLTEDLAQALGGGQRRI